VEAISIPRREDNAEALELSRRGIRQAASVALDPRLIADEENVIHAEVTSLMTAIEELGKGSHARGAIMALQAGWIDVPFSPSSYNSGGLISARDCDGAIRIWNAERFPFPTKVIDFHKERMNQRMTLERRSRMAELIQSDLVRISRCDFLRWPLDGIYVS
jgi:methylaspartate mutase epsilon subunit